MTDREKDCQHHWHHVGTEWLGGPYGTKVRTDRCCYCGETKVTRIEPATHFDFSVDESDCGPFKPDTRVWW